MAIIVSMVSIPNLLIYQSINEQIENIIRKLNYKLSMIKQPQHSLGFQEKDSEKEELKLQSGYHHKNEISSSDIMQTTRSEDGSSPRSQKSNQQTERQIDCLKICIVTAILLTTLFVASMLIINSKSHYEQSRTNNKTYVITPKQNMETQQSIQIPTTNTKLRLANESLKINQKNNQTSIQIPQVKNKLDRKEDLKIQVQANPKKQPFNSKWQRLNNGIKQASKYYQIEKVKNYKQLPFCIISLTQTENAKQQILTSLSTQNYRNYVILHSTAQYSKNYSAYKQLIQSHCAKNTLILFVRKPINRDALQYLNRMHQQYNIYATYGKQEGSIEIYSFYFRVFELIGLNDFNQTHKDILANDCFEIIPLAILELCQIKMKKVQGISIQNISPFILKNNSRIFQSKRSEYAKLLKLSQNFDFGDNLLYFQQSLEKILIFKSMSNPAAVPKRMIKAIERQQMLYLPENHSLFDLEYLQFIVQYHIQYFQEKSKQIPFCITVLSHNNIQNDRYKKVMLSIVQQKYDNYHIVFLDDVSSDNNMNATIQFMKQLKFPRERIKYIQNKERKFATYNIMNAIFNYCQPDDVQVLIDGDDEIVGAYSLQVLNTQYQKNPNLWIVYTNHLTNMYIYGSSSPINNMSDVLLGGKRYPRHLISHTQSWRVKLLYSIPLAHHQNQKKQWLDTVYDDAIQHPLVQLSGVQRIEYIPQIMYLYNTNYGDNDDSTTQKRYNRINSYKWIISLQPLSRLNSLQDSKKDADVMAVFQADRDNKFYVVQV